MAHLRSSLWDYFFYRPSRLWPIDSELHSEEVSLLTSDNKQLVCLYLHTQSTKKNGVIFLLHGRGGNAARYAQYAKPLVQDGYDVFVMGYRGYGKSTGHPNHKNVLADATRAFEYFLMMPSTKYRKKILWGLSLGAQLAIRIAKDHPNTIDALVTEGAVASFKRAVTDYYPGILGRFFQWFISVPYAAEEDIRSLDQLPKLIIHSREDATISMVNSEILYANAGEPKFLLIIDGAHIRGLSNLQSPVYINAFNKVTHYNNELTRPGMICQDNISC